MKRILIVEDERAIRNLCHRVLTQMGHEPSLASGVQEAMEAMESLRNVDLLITDMRLPDGDGVQVIERFGERFPSSGVVVMTGSPLPQPRRARLEELGLLGMHVLFKPFEITQFQSVVKESLGRARKNR